MTEFVTISTVRELLAVQLESFRSAVQLLTGQINEEIKYIKNEVGDIKASLQYSSKDIEDIQAKIKSVEESTSEVVVHLKSQSTAIDSLYDQSEYLENQSRRNNIKLLGMPESESGETWDQSEKFFKDQVKASLQIEEKIEVERAHRVGQKREFFTRPDGSKVKARPRPIIAKIKNWKQKESIIKAARSIRPDGIKFIEDFSQRTLDKRNALVPKLKEAREAGKLAFFVTNRLIIKDKPPDGRPQRRSSPREESFDDEITLNINASE